MTAETLQLELSLDKTSVQPGQKSVAHAVVDVAADGVAADWERPSLSVLFVLDVSASMRGPPLEHVVQSVDRLVAHLTPHDRVGIVTFASQAHEIVPLRAVTPETKKMVQAAVHALEASANTNLEAGLKLAAEMLRPRTSNERSIMFLLSDGVPSVGLCTPLTLAELVRKLRPFVSVWALGYGPHHQEDILSAISSAGGGRYEYIPQPQICEFAFAKVLGAQGLIAADGVELKVKPAAGVEIVRMLGKPEMRFGADGLVINLPDLFAGSRRLLVAELTIATDMHVGAREVFSAELKYRALGTKETEVLARKLEATVSHAEPHLNGDAHRAVLLARCDEVRAEARGLADRGQFEGAAAVLEEMVRALEKAPGATTEGSPLAEALDELRDELMTMAAKPKPEEYKAFRRSQINVSVSGKDFSLASSSSSQGQNIYERQIIKVVAGDYPRAHLEQLSGLESGRKIELRAEQVLGRSSTADIVTFSPKVTRNHAKVIAQGGRFYVIDLGSANGTWLNGARVETHVLAAGDIIGLSDVRFRYDEEQEAKELRLMALTPDGNIYVVEKERLFVMGSSRACTMVIPSTRVGRQHAAVRWRDGQYWLEDYGSEFATLRPNGERIVGKVPIKDGDEVIFGDWTVKFVFRR